VAVAAGSGHMLALKNDGTLAAWGFNNFGQATVPAGLTGVVAIAARGDYSLALKGDGTLVGWGDNSLGQAAAPFGLNNVKAISAGDGHALALRADGTVVGWGDNHWVNPTCLRVRATSLPLPQGVAIAWRFAEDFDCHVAARIGLISTAPYSDGHSKSACVGQGHLRPDIVAPA